MWQHSPLARFSTQTTTIQRRHTAETPLISRIKQLAPYNLNYHKNTKTYLAQRVSTKLPAQSPHSPLSSTYPQLPALSTKALLTIRRTRASLQHKIRQIQYFITLYSPILTRVAVTLALLLFHRLVANVPLPGLINTSGVLSGPTHDLTPPEGLRAAMAQSMAHSTLGGSFQITGGRPTVLSLGLAPVFFASLATSAMASPPIRKYFPSVAALRYQGQNGQVQLELILHYLVLAGAMVMCFVSSPQIAALALDMRGSALRAQVALVTGVMLQLYIGNRIQSDGVGGGVGVLLAMGILVEYSGTITRVLGLAVNGLVDGVVLGGVVFGGLCLCWLCVWMEQLQVKVPLVYFGERSGGGGEGSGVRDTYYPVKVVKGIMPFILAEEAVIIIKFVLDRVSWLPTSWGPVVTSQAMLLGLTMVCSLIDMQGTDAKQSAKYLEQLQQGLPGVIPGAPTERQIKRVHVAVRVLGGALLTGLLALACRFDAFCMSVMGATLQVPRMLIVVSVYAQISSRISSIVSSQKVRESSQKSLHNALKLG